MSVAKLLQALGIALVIIGLVQGISAGDMWGELYFALSGILLFYVGRIVERRHEKRIASARQDGASDSPQQ